MLVRLTYDIGKLTSFKHLLEGFFLVSNCVCKIQEVVNIKHRHRRNVTKYHFLHYFSFFGYYHRVGEVGEVSSLTPVKSSLGIITYQGHISQVS